MCAKKKFDVKSTLAVPSQQISPDQVEMAIRQIHNKPEPEQATSVPRALKAPKEKVSKPVIKRTPSVRKVRLSVDVLPEVHKKLKIKAVQNDTDIMHYVAMLIDRDLSL